MLKNVFKLDGPFQKFDEAGLVEHFRTTDGLKNALYEPNEWPALLRRAENLAFHNVSLSKTQFTEITLTGCRFEDCLFIGSAFQGVEFHQCEFVNCNFYRCEFRDCYIDPATIRFAPEFGKSTATGSVASNVPVEVYNKLLENSTKRRQATFGMVADIRMRRWKRRQLAYEQKVGRISLFQAKSKFLASSAYEVIADFGYSPMRLGITTLVVFSLVALLNANILAGALSVDGRVVQEISFADSVFYTYSMLTALGFSSITPVTDYAKIVAVFEALLGIGWLALFTAVLVKRVLR